MATLRRRPLVSVRIPGDIRPGRTFVAEVTLDAKSAVPVDWVDTELECKEVVTFGSGKSTVRVPHSHLRLVARLMDEGTLPAGKRVLRCEFTLPPELPPTYRGTRVTCGCTLSVHVSIPWWPDRRAEFDIVVRPNNRPPDDPPAMYGTHPKGPKGNDLALECSLDRRVIEPGGEILGMVALTNLASHRVRQLSVGLVSLETIRRDGRRKEVHEAERFVLQQAVPEETDDGEPIPFRMRIPDNVSPSWRSALWDLDWFLEVEAHVPWSRNAKLTIPVTLVPRGVAKAKTLRAPPTIGSERVTALWSKVASEVGWKLDGDVLRGDVGDVRATIRRDHRGGEGFVLHAELRYPSLHLGLDGGERRGFRRILGGGVSIGNPAWDRRHYLAGREPAQMEAFARAVGEALARVGLEDLDDDHAVLLAREAGLTLGPLRDFVHRAIEVALLIGVARGRIPAPGCMRDAIEAWKTLAKRLDGELELSRMGVVGRFEGDAVEVATAWGLKPEPTGTVLCLTLGDVPRAEQQVVWEAGHFTAGGREGLPEPCRDLLEPLLRGALAFQVNAREIRLTLPAPAMATEALLEALSWLRAFSLGLRTGLGPYR
jgi:hypothetical protein